MAPGIHPDVSDAIDHFMSNDVEANVPPEARHDSDLFRSKRLYQPRCHELLDKFEPVLRTIFDYYSTVEGDPLQLDLKTPEPLMSVEEWLGFLMDAGLVAWDEARAQDTEELKASGMPMLTHLEARLCFTWSQMFVSDELKRRTKLTQGTYIDFLEALGRICTRVALPSVQLLEKYGNRSAFEFFEHIAEDKHEGGVMLSQGHEAARWEKEEESEAPLHDSLEMLVGLVLDRLDSDRNGKIDKAELENRRRRRVQKRDFFLRTRNISYEACHGPDEGTQAHGDAQVLKLRGAPDAPPKGSMPASGAGGRAPRGGKKQAAVTF